MKSGQIKLPLFDDFWIEHRSNNTVRRWFKPEKFFSVPVGSFSSFIFDIERKKYRIYYEEKTDMFNELQHVLKCYESADLKHWAPLTKGESDVLYDGEKGLYGCSVYYDKYEPDAEKRYKLCGMMNTGSYDPDKGNWIGVSLAYSKDGIQFTRDKESVVCLQNSITLNKLIYNPKEKKYMVFHRADNGDKRISVTESSDLINWSSPKTLFQTVMGTNEIQHYSLTADYFSGVFYGLLNRFTVSGAETDYVKQFGYMEPELVYSYDGNQYYYTTEKPLVERPYAPETGCCGLEPFDITESSNHKEYYFICKGYNYIYGSDTSNAMYQMNNQKKGIKEESVIYHIRKDGFAGIESVGNGGMIITKPLCLVDDSLSFNIRANCGMVRFGIMDVNAKYLEGYSLDDCKPYSYSDGIDVKPSWNQKTLKELIGKRIRIAIELNSAILHCITMNAKPYLDNLQSSLSDPEIEDSRIQKRKDEIELKKKQKQQQEVQYLVNLELSKYKQADQKQEKVSEEQKPAKPKPAKPKRSRITVEMKQVICNQISVMINAIGEWKDVTMQHEFRFKAKQQASDFAAEMREKGYELTVENGITVKLISECKYDYEEMCKHVLELVEDGYAYKAKYNGWAILEKR